MVTGNPHIRMSTSVIDYIFRELAISYLGRNELAQAGAERPAARHHRQAALGALRPGVVDRGHRRRRAARAPNGPARVARRGTGVRGGRRLRRPAAGRRPRRRPSGRTRRAPRGLADDGARRGPPQGLRGRRVLELRPADTRPQRHVPEVRDLRRDVRLQLTDAHRAPRGHGRRAGARRHPHGVAPRQADRRAVEDGVTAGSASARRATCRSAFRDSVRGRPSTRADGRGAARSTRRDAGGEASERRATPETCAPRILAGRAQIRRRIGRGTNWTYVGAIAPRLPSTVLPRRDSDVAARHRRPHARRRRLAVLAGADSRDYRSRWFPAA